MPKANMSWGQKKDKDPIALWRGYGYSAQAIWLCFFVGLLLSAWLGSNIWRNQHVHWALKQMHIESEVFAKSWLIALGYHWPAFLCFRTAVIAAWQFRSCLVVMLAHFVPPGLPVAVLSQASLTSLRVRRPYRRWTLTDPGACLAYFIDIAVVRPSPISSVMRVARPECGRSLATSALHCLPDFLKNSKNLGASRRTWS